MTITESIVGRATEADLEGILALQEANQIKNGGTLSASLPRERIQQMLKDMPLIVARRDGQITGFLMTTSREMNADFAIVQNMFEAYPGSADAYVYGPICVDAQARGQRLAQKMFAELCDLVPGREGVLFIKGDNEPSLRAHERMGMGMKEVATFDFNGARFVVFSYVGEKRQPAATAAL